jgi:hypothetical protein
MTDKTTARWIDDLRIAMDAIDGLAIDERMRKTIWRALSSEFVEAVDRNELLTTTVNAGKKWTEEDDAIIVSVLSGKPKCTSWTEEKIRIEEVALRVKRPVNPARKRAVELGFADSITYVY